MLEIIKQNTITILLSLLLFSTFTYFEGIYFKFIDVSGANNSLYVVFISLISLLSYILLYNEKQSKNSYQISMLFVLLSFLTLITAPFKEYPLGAIIGTSGLLSYGISLFIIAPAVIKMTDYLKSQNKDIVEILVAIFIIFRAVFELIFPKTITISNDFMAFTALFALTILSTNTNLKNINKTEIIKIIAIITAILMVLLSDNRASLVILLIIFPAVLIFNLYGINKLSRKKIEKINLFIPISLLILTTGFILLTKSMELLPYDRITNTIWQRGAFLQSAIAAFDFKTLLIGNGWGLSNMFIMDSVWTDGVKTTINNQENYSIRNSIPTNIVGLGIDNIHNDLFEYLISGGIIALGLYIYIWYKLSQFVKNNMIAIAILSVISTLYSIWFTSTENIALLIVMIGIISYDKTKIVNKYEKITKPYILITSLLLFIFMAFIYTPYINSFATKVPKQIINSWYGANYSGFRSEKIFLRKKIDIIMSQIFVGNKVSQQDLFFLADAIEKYKILSKQGNKSANFELTTYYNNLFYRSDDKSNPKMEIIRKKEYPNWEKAVLELSYQFPNRPDLLKHYLKWHTDRNFDTTVDKVTKKMLSINPQNPVGLYYRGILLKKRSNESIGNNMIESAFKNNITRYQSVKPEHYEKYKHLLDEKYK